MRQREGEEVRGLLNWLFGETRMEDNSGLGMYARS